VWKDGENSSLSIAAHHFLLLNMVVTNTLTERRNREYKSRSHKPKDAYQSGGAKFYASALRRRLPAYCIVVDEQSLMMNARGFYLIAQDLLG